MANRKTGERVTFDLGNGKQVIVANGRLMLWANRGCLGVQMTPEQMQDVGLALWQIGRKMNRQCGAG